MDKKILKLKKKLSESEQYIVDSENEKAIEIINDVIGIIKKQYNDDCKASAETDYYKRICIRNIAVLEILFATGARVSEICSLTPGNIDLSNHFIKILGKGSKERIIQIENSDVLQILTEYSEAFRNDIENSGFCQIILHIKNNLTHL